MWFKKKFCLNWKLKIKRMNQVGGEKKESDFKNFNNERYFEALVKPKHNFNDLNLTMLNDGYYSSIFSSLPLYEV